MMVLWFSPLAIIIIGVILVPLLDSWGYLVSLVGCLLLFVNMVVDDKLKPRGPLRIRQNGLAIDEERWPVFTYDSMDKLEWGPNRHILITTSMHQELRLHFKTPGNADKVFQMIQEQMALAARARPAGKV